MILLCFPEVTVLVNDKQYLKVKNVCNLFPWCLHVLYEDKTPLITSIINDNLPMFRLLHSTHISESIPFVDFETLKWEQIAYIVNKEKENTDIYRLLEEEKRESLAGSYQKIFSDCHPVLKDLYPSLKHTDSAMDIYETEDKLLCMHIQQLFNKDQDPYCYPYSKNMYAVRITREDGEKVYRLGILVNTGY
jgi:hypothetical protein